MHSGVLYPPPSRSFDVEPARDKYLRGPLTDFGLRGLKANAFSHHVPYVVEVVSYHSLMGIILSILPLLENPLLFLRLLENNLLLFSFDGFRTEHLIGWFSG